MSDTAIYKKVDGKYVKIAPYNWYGFPSDGIWIVKFRNKKSNIPDNNNINEFL